MIPSDMSSSRSLYEPLDAKQRKIRLLKISSRPTSDAVEYILETFELTSAPTYKALSYMWGPKDDPGSIRVNDIDLSIRRNLYDFMQLFQTRGDQPWIWIDQISINQDDIEERGCQVCMMGEIYKGASETLIWLGLDTHQGIAFAFIQRVLTEFRAWHAQHTSDRDYFDEYANFWDSVDTDLDYDERTAVFTLTSNPYWSRHWVAQENVLSTKRILLYGKSEIPFDDFEHVQTEIGPMMDIFHLNNNFNQSNDFTPLVHTWEAVTTFTATSQCEDPRDKVYGIQGLLPPHFRVDVEYTRPVWDLFLATVRAWYVNLETWNTEWAETAFLKGCINCAIGMKLVAEGHEVLALRHSYKVYAAGTGQSTSNDSWKMEKNWEALKHALAENLGPK